MLAIGCGMVVGKTVIHSMILSRFLRLKMFRADQVYKWFFSNLKQVSSAYYVWADQVSKWLFSNLKQVSLALNVWADQVWKLLFLFMFLSNLKKISSASNVQDRLGIKIVKLQMQIE